MAGTAAPQGTGVGQASPQAPAPATAPPIPAAPARPGAATGAVTGTSPALATDVIVTDVIRQSGQGDAGSPQSIIIQQPPYRDFGSTPDIPPEIIPILGIVMGALVILGLGFPIIRTVTRLVERRADKAYVRGADVEVHLRALQESVDTMAIEIERISESQRYQSKLLAERKAGALPPG